MAHESFNDKQNQPTEQIVRIPLTELYPYPNHPYGIREDQAMQDTQSLHDPNASGKTRSGYKAVLVSMRLAYLTKYFPKDVVRQMKRVLQSPHASALESSLRAGHKDDELSLLALLKATLDNA